MIKAADIFSGPGGLSLGMKRAGFSPVINVEKNKDAVETYASHTAEAEHLFGDIRKIDFTRYRGKIDVVFGGPPCQPFSTGGLRKGISDSRNMFPEFLRAINEIQPAAFVAENVPGLASKGHEAYLHNILAGFEDAGFKLSWRLLLAADYGVPQKRRRIFIVGMRDHRFKFPKPTHGPTATRPYIASGSVVSKTEPLGEPPDCPVVYAKYPDPRRNPYAGHVYNGGGRPIDLGVPCHTILASAGGYKTHWVDMLDIAPEYSATLMAGGKPRDGIVPGARRLTPEESKLIQTFPLDMWFAGSRSSQYTQIGDAVPPVLAEAVGNALREQMIGNTIPVEEYFDWEPRLPLFEDAR
jgi:DNA (cytosine-5)-methyltransferase 1